MNHWWKIQVYETQAILYWILGVLILNLGGWQWVGWLAIVWGWLTFFAALHFAMKNVEKIRNLFDLPL